MDGKKTIVHVQAIKELQSANWLSELHRPGPFNTIDKSTILLVTLYE